MLGFVESVWWVVEPHLHFLTATLAPGVLGGRSLWQKEPPGLAWTCFASLSGFTSQERVSEEAGGVSHLSSTGSFTWALQEQQQRLQRTCERDPSLCSRLPAVSV